MDDFPPRSRDAGRRRGAPAVSVLLPCRDAAPWLPACIGSLEAQTERELEVVAVDDASGDATGELVDTQEGDIRLDSCSLATQGPRQ